MKVRSGSVDFIEVKARMVDGGDCVEVFGDRGGSRMFGEYWEITVFGGGRMERIGRYAVGESKCESSANGHGNKAVKVGVAGEKGDILLFACGSFPAPQ
jgi:hypothetical protein